MFCTKVFSVLLAALFALQVHAYPNGSPVCDFGNGTEVAEPMRMQVQAPIFALSSSSAAYTPGSALNITLKSTTNNSAAFFTGILLYAVAGDGSRVGTWQLSSGYKTLSQCDSTNATLTHSNNKNRPSGTTLRWRAPASAVGSVTFVGVIVVPNSLLPPLHARAAAQQSDMNVEVLANFTLAGPSSPSSSGSPSPSSTAKAASAAAGFQTTTALIYALAISMTFALYFVQ
ncbi:reeler domain-containing protein [Polychytrium aggregatum]|uniref:reeler domain-containing protein n=1 Tax=Polychytrium aggregatum TaxID=110093 RepID=UPI0022FE1795|nr:reeler domain-containing protein [Polychytrium aggregatum]KAI9202692.1 reeler domain-containing protein [Polychytrium aggregatum]